MIIKALLLLALGGAALVVQRRPTALRLLLRRSALLLTIVCGVIAVLFPDLTTQVARLVGVGRGTDLVLYALCVAFLFVSVSLYLRLGEIQDRYVELARRIALDEAQRELNRR